jgi:hypothetical protein
LISYNTIYEFVTTDVLHQSKPLPGSPFACDAYDPSKVLLKNIPKGQLVIHNPVYLNGKYPTKQIK